MIIRQHQLPPHGLHKQWGVMVHTTGDGIPKRIIANSSDPLEEAINVYSSMKEGPHYCIAPDGDIVQFRQVTGIAWHCGMSDAERHSYLSGNWDEDNRLDPRVVSWWKARWPGRKSPAHLYPSKRPNEDYLGIELIPCGSWVKGSWSWMWGTPAGTGERFSVEQYTALAMLLVRLSPMFPDGWMNTSRLVEHSDINPIKRPGWDIGVMYGRFSWQRLVAGASTMLRMGAKSEQSRFDCA